mgnify:CR=1 FL=1
MAESGANISRLTSALQRNEELTKELEAIVQVSRSLGRGRSWAGVVSPPHAQRPPSNPRAPLS